MKDTEISEWFWSLIKNANLNRDTLRGLLANFSKDDLIKFQEEFIDASVELQEAPFVEYMEESEDGVEDIANWIVSKGKAFYFHVLNNPEETPNSVNDLTDQILYGIADEVCVEKYGESTGIY
ncbi:Uncharacterised protein [Sphingobacterium spiritivorum]|uniref:DUF4240 domain-containing protein n=1 Tax=Sphingobacterium spiritivorum TaxID=258 RepID=A0A380B942_SPHSI|nr:DUF4240 domain-containing protein [Sphingobacterium spiritivorum]SUI96918.1 Uncharacterised protein [Sphingobacterium spiritivorum]